MEDDDRYLPSKASKDQITLTLSPPYEKKATITSYMAYTLAGSDADGSFQGDKRYSDFDHTRNALLQRWPGCFVPPLPVKKIIGNSDSSFLEQRRKGLETFLWQVSKLPHLWYSKEFQALLRGTGDMEKILKGIPPEAAEDIVKKYESRLVKLQGRVQDTALVGRVLEFGAYLKKIQDVLANFRQIALEYVQARHVSADQTNILLNYVLPEYEKTCLSVFSNQMTEGKFIFNESNDEKLASLIAKLKELMGRKEFDELYFTLELEGREVEAFLEVYRIRDSYERQLKDLRVKEKDLEVDLVKLNSGKQGLFSGLMGKIEDKKAKAQNQLQVTRKEIKVSDVLLEKMIVLLGCFEIERFRRDKLDLYFRTIKGVAEVELEVNAVKREICDHVLENHNLM